MLTRSPFTVRRSVLAKACGFLFRLHHCSKRYICGRKLHFLAQWLASALGSGGAMQLILFRRAPRTEPTHRLLRPKSNAHSRPPQRHPSTTLEGYLRRDLTYIPPPCSWLRSLQQNCGARTSNRSEAQRKGGSRTPFDARLASDKQLDELSGGRNYRETAAILYRLKSETDLPTSTRGRLEREVGRLAHISTINWRSRWSILVSSIRTNRPIECDEFC